MKEYPPPRSSKNPLEPFTMRVTSKNEVIRFKRNRDWIRQNLFGFFQDMGCNNNRPHTVC